MKITTLFYRSVLFFQIKILLAAEKDTHKEILQPSQTLSYSGLHAEQSCSIDNNTGTTNNAIEETGTATETVTETTTETVTETTTETATETKTDAQLLERQYMLYKDIKIKYTEKHGCDIPNFGINVKEIQNFNKIVLSLDILNYSQIKHDDTFHIETESEIKEMMEKHTLKFHESMEKMKILIKKKVPKVEKKEQETSLRESYKKFNALNWSYFNDKIVVEAEKIFDNMKWTGPIPKQTSVLNVPLYHKLYNLVNELKDNILNLNKNLKHFRLMNKSYSYTIQNAMLRPLSMFLPTHRKHIFTELHLELKKFIKYCDNALKTENKRLSNTHNYVDLVNAIKNVLTHIDEHLRMYSKVVTTSLQKEKGKGNDLLISLVVHFFKFLNDSNVKQQNILNEKWQLDDKTQLEKILKILKAESDLVDLAKNSSLEALQKVIKKTLQKKQLEHVSDNLKTFAKYYMKISVLLQFKHELLFLLSHLNDSITVSSLNGDDSCSDLEKGTCAVINESGVETVKIALEEVSRIVLSVIEMASMEKTLNVNEYEESKMHGLIRELQFHFGSACSYFSKMRENPSYPKETPEYIESLKKILHCFWNANNAIQKFYDDKKDS